MAERPFALQELKPPIAEYQVGANKINKYATFNNSKNVHFHAH